MISAIIRLLTEGLGPDHPFVKFLQPFIDKIGEGNIKIIEIFFVTTLVILFIYGVTWSKYKKQMPSSNNLKQTSDNFADFIEHYWVEICFKLLIGIALIVLIYGQGFGYDILSGIVKWFSYNGTEYEGLLFVFGYQKGIMYEWYNVGRWLIIITAFALAGWNAIWYYLVYDGSEGIKRNGDRTNHYSKIKSWGSVLLVGIFLLFSVFPEMIVNGVIHIISNKSLHDIITGTADLSSSLIK